MVLLVLALIPTALAVSWPATAILVRLGHRLMTYDGAGVEGQIKAPARTVPNTGGIAIVLGFVVPLGMILAAGRFGIVPDLGNAPEHVPGMIRRFPQALALIGCTIAVHVLGLVDDRRPLGPGIKLGVMLAVAGAAAWLTDSRLLTLLDSRVGGPWLSFVVTVLWLVTVMNAINFMDNMDGLAAGVGAVACGCFLAGALIQGQWFVGSCLALLLGSTLGFLAFNRPPARIFMGDGGSLVIGFLLGLLTVRATYVHEGASTAGAWYGVLMPLVVLAVPLYDFVAVTALRLSQGRSPFVGDLQHLSHRLERLGLSRGRVVGVVCGLSAMLGLSGVFLGSLQPWQAVLVGVQTVLALLVLGVFEHGTTTRGQA